MLFALLLAAAPAPHASLQEVVSSNGYGTLGYSIATHRFDRFIQHPYKYEAAGVATRNLLVDSYFGVRKGSDHAWLSNLDVTSAGYVPGTSVIKVEQSWTALPGVILRTYGFAPRDLHGPAYVMLLEVVNDSAAALDGLEVFSMHNQRHGAQRPLPSGDGEFIDWRNGAFVEFGPPPDGNGVAQSGATSVYLPLAGAVRRTSGGRADDGSWVTNPYHQLEDLNVDFTDTLETAFKGYNANDMAVGYQWKLANIAAGASAWAAVVVSTDPNSQDFFARGLADDWLEATSDPQTLLAREVALWSAPTLPKAMPLEEQALYAQSLAVMQMAQVQEGGPLGRSRGQILASLSAATAADANQWNITWVRDMAYSVVALSETGHFAEARAALEFQLRAGSGNFQSFVGVPYQVSVCRYTGDGLEESDQNENGPNIEFDGFGLFLWSASRYVALSGDKDFLSTYWAGIHDQISEPLVQLVEPYSSVVKSDSSIWEVHWNGQQKQYTYSSLAAVAGFCGASELAHAEGDEATARRYRNLARTMRSAIQKNNIDTNNVLASSIDELRTGKSYSDAAVLDAWGLNLFDATQPIYAATLASLAKTLTLPSGGFFRNDNGGAYDAQEWIFVDMRRAASELRIGSVGPEYAWVVAQSAKNANLIAELYDHDTADYAGSVPMVGFGAGAFILTANQKYALTPVWQPCGGYDNTLETDAPTPQQLVPTTAQPAPKKGCTTTGGDTALWVSAVVMLFLAKRQRKVPES